MSAQRQQAIEAAIKALWWEPLIDPKEERIRKQATDVVDAILPILKPDRPTEDLMQRLQDSLAPARAELEAAGRLPASVTDEMVERAALALYEETGCPPSAWASEGTPRGMVRRHARAALEAALHAEDTGEEKR